MKCWQGEPFGSGKKKPLAIESSVAFVLLQEMHGSLSWPLL